MNPLDPISTAVMPVFCGSDSASQMQVVWNAHRIYGPARLPLLTANWELLGAWDESGWVKDFNKFWSFSPQRLSQPLLVLKNRRSEPCSRS